MPEGEVDKKPKIERLEKGDTERTARHADVMNEIIDRLNSITELAVLPEGIGKFMWADANATLVLNVTDCTDTAITSD